MRLAAASQRLLATIAIACVAATAPHAQPRGEPGSLSDSAVTQLPAQAHDTLARIRAGGPFPFERDGVRFGNRERLLPEHPRDYYREYTVKTPGARTRGARRIVCGGAARTPDVCYYTDDHYRSFRRIRQ